MFLNTVHHVAIIVSDYDLSRDFYVNKLGFEIIRENHRPERHDYKLDLRCGGIEFEIFGKRSVIRTMWSPQNVRLILRHVAYVI